MKIEEINLHKIGLFKYWKLWYDYVKIGGISVKNVEPLLKDEVETFPFLNDNKKPEKNKKTNKVKKEMIIFAIKKEQHL